MSLLPHRLPCLVSAALVLLAAPMTAVAGEPERLYTPMTPAPPAPPPAPPQMLIWGGGTTREEAEKSLAEFRAEEGGWLEYYKLAEGFPRVLESKTVPGLKPGFFVVALGVCPAKTSPSVLGVMKVSTPFVYARPVTWDTADKDCPDSGKTSVDARTWKKKGLELVAVQVARDDGSWEMTMHLHDKAGKLLDTVLVDSTDARSWAIGTCDTNDSSLDDGGPRASFGCDMAGCTTLAHLSYDTVYGIDVSAGKIQSKEVNRNFRPGECD